MTAQSNGAPVRQPPRFQLSSTHVPGLNRGVGVGLTVVFVPVVLAAILGGAGLAGSGDLVLTLLGIVLLVVGVAGLLAVAASLVYAFRYAAWLEGTVLVRRGAFTTGRVDLATAQSFRVRLPMPGGVYVPVPALYAGGDASGRSLTVTFKRARNGFVPAPEAEALARAIGAGRRAGFAAQQADDALRALQHLAVGAPVG